MPSIGRVLGINFSKAAAPADIIAQRCLQKQIVDIFNIRNFDGFISFTEGEYKYLSEVFARNFATTEESYHDLEDIAHSYLKRLDVICNRDMDDLLYKNGLSPKKIHAAQKEMTAKLRKGLKQVASELAYVVMGQDEPRRIESSANINPQRLLPPPS